MKKSHIIVAVLFLAIVFDAVAIYLVVGHYDRKCASLQSEIDMLRKNTAPKAAEDKAVAAAESPSEESRSRVSRKAGQQEPGKLLDKIKDMKKKLDESEKKIAEIQSSPDKKADGKDGGGNPHWPMMGHGEQSYTDSFAKMKESDPEGLKARMESTRKFASFSFQVMDERRNFYENLDLSLLDEEQLKSNQEFLEMNRKIQEISEKVANSDNPDEVAGLMDEREGLIPQYFDLLRKQRDAALLGFARTIGYDRDEGRQLLEYIKYLDSMSRPRFYRPDEN